MPSQTASQNGPRSPLHRISFAGHARPCLSARLGRGGDGVLNGIDLLPAVPSGREHPGREGGRGGPGRRLRALPLPRGLIEATLTRFLEQGQAVRLDPGSRRLPRTDKSSAASTGRRSRRSQAMSRPCGSSRSSWMRRRTRSAISQPAASSWFATWARSRGWWGRSPGRWSRRGVVQALSGGVGNLGVVRRSGSRARRCSKNSAAQTTRNTTAPATTATVVAPRPPGPPARRSPPPARRPPSRRSSAC
jgi:hypothetical protein